MCEKSPVLLATRLRSASRRHLPARPPCLTSRQVLKEGLHRSAAPGRINLPQNGPDALVSPLIDRCRKPPLPAFVYSRPRPVWQAAPHGQFRPPHGWGGGGGGSVVGGCGGRGESSSRFSPSSIFSPLVCIAQLIGPPPEDPQRAAAGSRSTFHPRVLVVHQECSESFYRAEVSRKIHACSIPARAAP